MTLSELTLCGAPIQQAAESKPFLLDSIHIHGCLEKITPANTSAKGDAK